MKIHQIDIYKSNIKLKEPFIISLGVLDSAKNIIIVIHTDEGIKGTGECSPFMTINGETADSAFIIAQLLAKSLIGQDPTNIGACIAIMDKIIYGNSSIKSAFDIALHDIASQQKGIPLYAYLGGFNNKALVTDYTVSLNETEKMIGDAEKIKSNGFTIIKVKLGRSIKNDLASIKGIREAVGNDITIRIDANQGWNVTQAPELLQALAAYNIQHCEEPIPRWEFMQLKSVKDASPIPIMADESICDHHDAKRLIDLKACHRFNVKLGKSGGLYNAIKIVRLAEEANITMQIGGFLESILGFTASAHLALSSDQIKYFDFDSPMMFEEDLVIGGISYHKDGVVKVAEVPGLGAEYDPGFLNKLEKIIINNNSI